MSLSVPLLWSDGIQSAQLARIAQRRKPSRRLLGMLAAAIQCDATMAFEHLIGEALSWPDTSALDRLTKASLLFGMTALLSRSRYRDLAFELAPRIPHAPGMSQVLEFTTEHEYFCWRVTSAYALVHGCQTRRFPVQALIQPYQRGQVHIDESHVQQMVRERKGAPPPILLLAHPLGMFELDGRSYIILDGNHRVVSAWRRRRGWIAGYELTPQEGEAVLIQRRQHIPELPLDNLI
jgi:hypothetical protein